jgi:hypothetical protein
VGASTRIVALDVVKSRGLRPLIVAERQFEPLLCHQKQLGSGVEVARAAGSLKALRRGHSEPIPVNPHHDPLTRATMPLNKRMLVSNFRRSVGEVSAISIDG